MPTFSVPECVKCLGGVKYDDIKHSTHFEWVVEYESTLKKLISEVFENVGVEDEFSVNLTVKAVDNFQEYLKIRILALARKLSTQTHLSEDARKLATGWSEGVQYQMEQKYHMIGGPDAKKLHWVFSTAMDYIIVCSTGLADRDENVEFKKDLSKYIKDVYQHIIDILETLKSELIANKSS